MVVSGGLTAANGGTFRQVATTSIATGIVASTFVVVGGAFADLGLTNPEFLSGGHLAKIAAHGLVGGGYAELWGGDFASGAIGAAVAQFAAPAVDAIPGDGVAGITGRTIVAAVAGGVGAELGGGKFANGAVTAAFARFFNDELSRLTRQLAAASNSGIPKSSIPWWKLEGQLRNTPGTIPGQEAQILDRMRRGLESYEGVQGGHLLRKHGGKPVSYLRHRLATENRSVVSTFFSPHQTAQAAARTINVNQARIEAWVRTGSNQLLIKHTFDDPVGIILSRTATAPTFGNTANFILRNAPGFPGGFRIHTGFVTP